MLKQGKPSATRMAQRGIWFFIRTILLVVLLIGLCYSAFTIAMRMSNLYILATEGLQLRAACVLQAGARAELPEYFTQQFINEDSTLNSGKYENYTISDYDLRVEVEGISVWPWSKTATVTVVERMVSLPGTLNEDQTPSDAAEGTSFTPPAWENARYKLRFNLTQGRWYLYQMQLVETAPIQAARHTPDMSITPVPMATPAPVASPTPTASPQSTASPMPGVSASPAPAASGTP